MSFQPLDPNPTVRFSHGVTYLTPEPVIEVEIAATDALGVLLGTPQRTSVLVDSGADYTILDDRIAPILGIDLDRCRPATVIAVGGGSIPGKAAPLWIGLCGIWVHAVTIFQERPTPQLLGREGVFDQLAITFVQGESRLLAAVA